MSAARQNEQQAHDCTEVAVAGATSETQADMLHELFCTEQVAGSAFSNQQMEIPNQTNSVAENVP